LSTGTRPRYVLGVGVYDIPVPFASHWYVQHHTQAAVLARGGLLLQHRDPPMNTWAGVNFFGDGVTEVGNIEPQEIEIWTWPPWAGGSPQFIDGSVEPAPWAVTFIMVEIPDRPGHYERVLAPAPMTIPPGRFSHATPSSGIAGSPVRWPSAPKIGDVYLPGLMPGTAPVDPQTVSIPAALPRTDPVARYQAMAQDPSLWASRPEPAWSAPTPGFRVAEALT
jgi:hypothetical protein